MMFVFFTFGGWNEAAYLAGRIRALQIEHLHDHIGTNSATVAMLAAIWCVFLYVPNERTQGAVQRIFYFHVGSAWACFIAFFVGLERS